MHPALYFIRYLLTTGSSAAESNEWIRESLDRLDLFHDKATDELLDAVRDGVKPPDDVRLGLKNHAPTISFLKELRVYEMHAMTTTCKQACAIRNDPTAREELEPLLLARIPFPQAARTLSRKIRSRYSTEAVALFYHYFFNVENVPRSFWPDVTRKRKNGGLLKMALLGHPDLVLWKGGENIIVETRKALESAFTQCHMRLLELQAQPTNMATMKMLQCAIDGLVRVYQAMSESEVRMKDVLRQLANFQQARAEMSIPSAYEMGEISAQLRADEKHQMLPPPPADGDYKN